MPGRQSHKLLRFLERLEAAKIPFHLRKDVEDAIGVLAFAPGEYWEIDFLADGQVYVERFRSDGHIEDESAIDAFFEMWKDDAAPTNGVGTNSAPLVKKREAAQKGVTP